MEGRIVTTDIAIPTQLSDQVEYAKLVAVGSMLPAAYRGKPADILIAMGLGASMGLSPAESLYRIHVIQGRPTASAELIAANVRRAGHRLRVEGDETHAVASVWRSDDPEFEFRAEWNMSRAQKMGLHSKENWRNQPGTMLRWRAITEVARLACPEALYGVVYTPDESEDHPQRRTSVSAADVVGEVIEDADVIDQDELPLDAS